MRIGHLARTVALAGFFLPTLASANEFEGQLRDLAASEIRGLVANPSLIEAIKAQNDETNGLGENEIIALDNQWRAEIGTTSTPTISRVLDNPASAYLRDQREASAGLYTEIFVMDARGLNVAASNITSDYWQGDEAKWQQTYPVGPDALHIGDIELDESTQSYQSQISVPVTDPATGQTIGAATVGVNVEFLN